MKQMVRFFSMGMMVSTLLLAAYYYLFAEDKTVPNTESPPLSEEEMIDRLEKTGFTVMSAAETEKEKQVNTNQTTLQQEEVNKVAPINIKKGMNLADISKKLQEENIIEDAEAFSYYMDAKGNSKKIKIGSFKLKKEMSYKEIAEVIIGK